MNIEKNKKKRTFQEVLLQRQLIVQQVQTRKKWIIMKHDYCKIIYNTVLTNGIYCEVKLKFFWMGKTNWKLCDRKMDHNREVSRTIKGHHVMQAQCEADF